MKRTRGVAVQLQGKHGWFQPSMFRTMTANDISTLRRTIVSHIVKRTSHILRASPEWEILRVPGNN